MSPYRSTTHSRLEVYDIESGVRQTIREFERIIEAPNWPNENTLYYNADGRIWRYSLETHAEEAVDTGFCLNCNNDHVPSGDGKSMAVSHMDTDDGAFHSRIYAVPLEGGEPVRMTDGDIDFLHGWSQDGLHLAWCAFKQASCDQTSPSSGGGPVETDVDIYVKDLPGGVEKRLTFGSGYSDGPEFDPTGETVWFNSTMDGLMQIYTVPYGGGCPVRMLYSDHNDWFPHISPDGRKVVFLAYRKEDLQPSEHLPDKRVSLYMMNSDGSGLKKLLDVFGGQGTLNVNSWAPDSRRFAFVSYF